MFGDPKKLELQFYVRNTSGTTPRLYVISTNKVFDRVSQYDNFLHNFIRVGKHKTFSHMPWRKIEEFYQSAVHVYNNVGELYYLFKRSIWVHDGVIKVSQWVIWTWELVFCIVEEMFVNKFDTTKADMVARYLINFQNLDVYVIWSILHTIGIVD